MRPFNALNGQELIEYVVDKVRKELERDNRFSIGTAYPIIKYGFRLRVEAYPLDQGSFEISIEGSKVEPEEVEGEAQYQAEQLGAPTELKAEVLETIEDSDAARERAELPVPVPTRLKTGEMVDIVPPQAGAKKRGK